MIEQKDRKFRYQHNCHCPGYIENFKNRIADSNFSFKLFFDIYVDGWIIVNYKTFLRSINWFEDLTNDIKTAIDNFMRDYE